LLIDFLHRRSPCIDEHYYCSREGQEVYSQRREGGREGFLLHTHRRKIKRRGGKQEGFSLMGSWFIFKPWPGIPF